MALCGESNTDDFQEALLMWKVTGVRVDYPTECICTHSIVENCFVENVNDGRTLIIGNCCIRRFFPEGEREKMEDFLKAEKRKTRDCTVCKIRYQKEEHPNMCEKCREVNRKCDSCDNVYRCKEDERKWKKLCGTCLEKQTGKKLKGNHSPVDGRKQWRYRNRRFF
ncbi:hypothetical protein HDV00_012387 [Rhizophlyctis rosea]|nr:hypothetical protein HDV00_012387 [Rhizophlyctis rosea]